MSEACQLLLQPAVLPAGLVERCLGDRDLRHGLLAELLAALEFLLRSRLRGLDSLELTRRPV